MMMKNNIRRVCFTIPTVLAAHYFPPFPPVTCSCLLLSAMFSITCHHPPSSRLVISTHSAACTVIPKGPAVSQPWSLSSGTTSSSVMYCLNNNNTLVGCNYSFNDLPKLQQTNGGHPVSSTLQTTSHGFDWLSPQCSRSNLPQLLSTMDNILPVKYRPATITLWIMAITPLLIWRHARKCSVPTMPY